MSENTMSFRVHHNFRYWMGLRFRAIFIAAPPAAGQTVMQHVR